MTVRFCKTCEKPIPEGRLKVVPNATQCVPCKEKTGDDPGLIGYYVYSEDFHGDPSSGTLHVTTQESLDQSRDEKYSKRRKK